MERFEGHFINLDRSTDRRAVMEQSLARVGFDGIVSRFSACEGDGRPSKITQHELGCFLSHQSIVEGAKGDRHLLIMEDDLYFPDQFARYFAAAERLLDKVDGDMLFLNKMTSFIDVKAMRRLIVARRTVGDINAPDFRKFSINNAKYNYVSGTGAYIIRKESIGKIAALMEANAADGYQRPIDMVYVGAIHSDKIAANFIFPYIVGINSDFAPTISDRSPQTTPELFNDILNLFVAGGDRESLAQRSGAATPDEPDFDAMVASRIVYRWLAKRAA